MKKQQATPKYNQLVCRLFLIHWSLQDAQIYRAMLERDGHQVEIDFQSFAQWLKGIRENPPDAILIDLSRLPSQGRDLAVALRQAKATQRIPLVFIGGEPSKVARVRKLLPDACFTDWECIKIDLPKAISQPTTDPIAPATRMAAYQGRSLIQKLGVKAGIRRANFWNALTLFRRICWF